MKVAEELERLADAEYRSFHLKLVPGIDAARVLGVRIPLIRALAKRMDAAEKDAFLTVLPHYYYEENVLHAVIVSGFKDAERAAAEVARFLPYVDNWAVCDAISPKCFGRKENAERVRVLAYGWCDSPHLYTARYGVNCLRDNFLDGNYVPDVLRKVAGTGGGYYLDMAAAWFFCDALIKRWDDAVAYLEKGNLSPEVHRKAVRKACDSFRITSERKEYLKSLPVPPARDF